MPTAAITTIHTSPEAQTSRLQLTTRVPYKEDAKLSDSRISFNHQLSGVTALKLFAVLIAIAWLMLSQPVLFAQATAGAILGNVTDSSGAIVPDANVMIINRDGNISTTAHTNISGNFTQGQPIPGRYAITINKDGFQSYSRENMTVEVESSIRLDARLQIGERTQQITVTEAAPGLVTDSAQVTSSMTAPQVEQLPVVNRNFTNLSLLAPGATLNTFQHAANENPQQSTLVNTSGIQFAGSAYVLDGMNSNDTVLGITMVNPPVESVADRNVRTSNYDAEYTQAEGAVILVETKSGSNVLHGSVFEYLQNNILQSLDPLTQGLHDPGTPSPDHRGVPELRYNQFGGSIGGPIIKDKPFFFADYQGTLRRMGGTQLIRVPTAAERSGNLGDLQTPIFDPSTGNPDGKGRTAFPGGIIPQNRFSPPALNVLSSLAAPNLVGANPASPNYCSCLKILAVLNPRIDISVVDDKNKQRVLLLFRCSAQCAHRNYLTRLPAL
jgi:hypothetical protein